MIEVGLQRFKTTRFITDNWFNIYFSENEHGINGIKPFAEASLHHDQTKTNSDSEKGNEDSFFITFKIDKIIY